MAFRKNDEEVELKVGTSSSYSITQPVNTNSKMDSLFGPSQPGSEQNQRQYDIDEKFRMLEYKIEKVMEQTSRIIDLLEKTTHSTFQQLRQEPQPNDTNINFPTLPNETTSNSNTRLW